MESTLGYSKAIIGILDENEKVVKKIEIEGNGKGGTVSAKIGGLESPTTSIDASDGIYYTSSSGVGKPTLEMEVVELTQEQKADLFGMEYENGILTHGKDTKAPYVAVMFVSEGLQNQEIYISLLKGKLSTDGVELQTGTADNGKDVTTLTISGAFETRGSDGRAYASAHSNAVGFTLEAFEDLVFPEAPVNP